MTSTLEQTIKTMQAEMLQRSEIVEPWHSYWYHRPLRNFPPPSIRFPSDYDGGERLSLACTQTDLPARMQRELLQAWCAILPTLSRVRVLWFQSKVTQDLFEAACNMPSLEGLYIKWSSISTLEPITRLAKLSHLHIGGAPSAQSINSLGMLGKLVDLELSNVVAAADLSFLIQLPQLKSLHVSGDSNSLKALKIKTLAPLAALPQLERLSISTASLEDESLEPISRLPKLKYLLLSNQFKMEEFAYLAGKIPSVDCDRFIPVGDAANWMTCKKCGEHSMLPLSGKGLPWLCGTCDAQRIEKHVQKFKQIARKAAEG